MNTVDAAYHTVHDYPGGSESLGPRVSISAAVLRNKVNPNNSTHHLTFAEAQRVAAFTNDFRMLLAWAHAEGFLLVKAPNGATECDMSVLEKVASFMFASGMFGKEIHESLADGAVDQDEMVRVTRAADQVMTEAAEVVQRLKGMVG